MKSKISLFLMFFAITFMVKAQEIQSEGAFYSGKVSSMEYVPSIASRMSELKPAEVSDKEAQDGRASGNKVIIGKDAQTEDDYFVRNQHPLTQKINGKAPILVFDAASSSSQPTDPSLAVGPNHVLVVFNTGFTIYDKSGNQLLPQTSPNPAIFPSGGCCDLTVSYDKAADRWVVSFLGAGAQIAVSDGPDPINDGWFVYTISQINDYQKLSVWSDGYYLTDNTSSSNKVWAMERDEMLLGNPAAGIQGFNLPGIATSGFYSPQALNVTDDNMPAPGGLPVIYLQDDAWAGVTQDHIKVWTIDVDWNTPANSTVSAPNQLNTTPFISVFDGGSFSNLTQPGGGIAIDALQATIMNQAQFRKFGGHNSAVFNFVVDTDASAGELAGVRWFELRQAGDGQPWTIHQEGTYTAPDGRHAWHASMMMDIQGNIGMGYSSMSGPTTPSTVRVSSYYTGRFASDPLNTMTIAEELIANGNANIPGLRYGDYSKIDIDPDDDKTFWFINEYMNNGRKDVVGVFKIAPNFNIDLGAVSIDSPVDGDLSNAEQITVTIFNYGQLDQSNIPLSLTVDGSLVANEVFAGTIPSSTSAQYTFTATVDMSTEGQTYEVTVATNFVGDEDNTNNSTTENITHILAADIGATAITSPNTGEGLGNETVTITMENFGTAAQSNFDVSYSINGGTPVVETVAGPIAPGATLSYTFATLADLSAAGTYNIESSTQLAADGDNTNDATTKEVINLSCNTETNATSMPIGPNGGSVTESVISIANDVTINDVNVTINLNHTFTGDLDIFLEGPDGTRVELSTDNGGSGDNMINTVFDDEAPTSITTGTAPFTGSFQPEGNLSDFDGLSSLGDWTLEITDDANIDGGTLNSWSLQLCEDVPLGLDDNFIDNSELVILEQGNNQFQIQLPTTTVTERMTFTVTNLLGQKLLSYRLDNVDGKGYFYDLDMSYAATGVYIVRIGNNQYGSAKRLIVR
ncbi:proprotein convertase P-domain-containing protein [Altibacter lentus]|uniref:proprotein convertase P-domain-containing protein n=1 Tax=Altibacter lentus TaxID=1223410 RepID=UPI00055044EF|nr:proprotein convertase P-domain-containing protein [Altibacter lentus]